MTTTWIRQDFIMKKNILFIPVMKLKDMKKSIESQRRERDALKAEPFFRRLQGSQLAKYNVLVSKQAVTVSSCMKRSQASLTSAEWASRSQFYVRHFTCLLKMYVVKGKDCQQSCESNGKCWLVCCLHQCHQPVLVEMAPLCGLKRGNSSSQASWPAASESRIQIKLLLPCVCLQ